MKPLDLDTMLKKQFRWGILAGIGIAAATMFFALWLAQFIYV